MYFKCIVVFQVSGFRNSEFVPASTNQFVFGKPDKPGKPVFGCGHVEYVVATQNGFEFGKPFSIPYELRH